MKNLGIVLVLVLAATGCGKLKGIGSHEPTANDCRKVFENVLRPCRIQVESLEKIRAYEETVMGTPVCYVDLRIKVKYLAGCNDWNLPPQALILHYGQPGEVYLTELKLPFEKTNKGFLGQDGNLY